MIPVTLAPYEVFAAAIVGVRRAVSKLGSKSRNYVDNATFGWHTDIEASCAEMAFAKAMGLYWDASVGTYGAPDVGAHQVRHTVHAQGHLLLKPGKVKNEQRYYLVTGEAPDYVIHGWILGGDGVVDEFWKEEYSYWKIPQARLNAPDREDV